ncbi:flagellar biosynthetic protein FliO [Paraburkholderia terricola]|uniref:Flagellar protein n=1 Tax=Paraburkholderia terricola TaxID=169427 RepID=A0ABU1LWN3_9BURK|nr:flagellar biosynthetic protein FliO [Paraburkholderia terricola]MDR6410940.1 flagellar protein FliO/FliZ [Paraburkholderia terricola]MDR6482684.1 flagellar protein FliO/FliZ [Paraburkholderia terricola]
MKRVVRRAVFAANVAAASALTFALATAPLAAQAADMNAVNNAAKMASGVGAGTAVPALGVGAVLQTIVGLLVVIGLVFGCAWLARRFGLQPANRGGLVKTIGGASLGGKERVAVVEIGDTWLVLGTAPGNVRLLHTMPAGSATADAAGGTPTGESGGPGVAGTGAALPGTFGQRFRDALKGEVGKRFNGQGGGVR